MKLIKLIKYFLVFVSFTALGQQKTRPIFHLYNRITAGSDAPQIHALWEGMRNPFIITCNDPKIKFTIHAKGGTVVNTGTDHAFDLIPHHRDVELFVISVNKDTLYVTTFISRKMILPTFKLLLNKSTIADNSSIYRNSISLLSIHLVADDMLKRDLIELPVYSIDKEEINLIRGNKAILTVSSMSALDSIKMNARNGDVLTIFISSYSYIDGLNNSITMNSGRVFKLKVI